jgi:CNT family concentrative nucleoside transporter
MVAQIMVPERDEPTAHAFSLPHPADSTMDAITQGTLDGVKLLLNIIALLIVLVALVNLVNQLLGVLPEVGGHPLTLQRLLGYIMAPVAWLMGVPWEEAGTGGTLLGIKTVLNEFLAYLELARLPEESLSPRSRLIMTYALCGFANFGSLGIMLGGLGTMAPERREEIIGLGLKSIVAGTLATCLTGAVVGLLLWTG